MLDDVVRRVRLGRDLSAEDDSALRKVASIMVDNLCTDPSTRMVDRVHLAARLSLDYGPAADRIISAMLRAIKAGRP